MQTSICRRVLFSTNSARCLLSARFSALPRSYQRNASAKSAAVFQGFAQREAQMITIDEPRGRRRFRRVHLRDFLLLETVRLQVGETPIGVAEVRPARKGATVGGDRLVGVPDGFLRMGKREMHIGILRGLAKHFPIDVHGALVLAEADVTGGIQRLQLPAVRLVAQKRLELDSRLLILMEIEQHTGVLATGHPIRRCQLENGSQQDLGIVEHATRDTDAGEQAHPFHVIALLEQEGAHHGLGRIQIAILEQSGRRHHLGRQVLQLRQLGRRGRRIVGPAGHPKQALEHPPTARQGMIEVHRTLKRSDRLRCFATVDEAPPLLLVQPAEARMVPLQGRKRAERLVWTAEVALRDGD